MALNFRYVHDNPYNSDMEHILNHYSFEELEDDGERIVYLKVVTNIDDFYDILKSYFRPNWTWISKSDISAFEFLPSSIYGWGFEKEVLVGMVDKSGDDMDEEFYIPIEKFIEIFK